MTPSGVHVNKTAIAVIIGILILIVIGFKYKGGAIKVVTFDEKGNKGVDLKRGKERGEILKRKEEEKVKIKEEELIKENEEKLKKKGEELKKKEEELKKKEGEELKKKEEGLKKKEELKKKEGEGLKKKEEEGLKKKEEEELKKKEGEGLKKKEEEGLEKKQEEIKKKEEQNQAVINRQEKKSTDKTESMAATIPDWKSVTWMETKIPDEIISSAAKMRVEEKKYNVMNRTIFARTVKPEGQCKGGVILLHGMKFTSKDWETITTLQHIAAMGYTPVAVDLPGYGHSDKEPVEDKAKFLEDLIKVVNFIAPVIISPSMSGSFALPYLLSDPKTADKKSHGFIAVAPVDINKYTDKYKDLQIPTALVYGENDTRMRDSVEKIMSTIPNSQLFMLKGAGHAAYLDKPEEWLKILYVFLPAAFNFFFF